MLSLKDVSKTYIMGKETITALDDVSVEIKRGELVAIMGPSGSGKSTLANIIGGLDTPDKGEVIFKDQNIAKLSDNELSEYRNKSIGFIFQSFNLQPNYTALENAALPLVFAKTNSKLRKAKAKKALEAVGLGHRLDHKPGELSGGERQRVSIARALTNEPELIIADEPTGNLDTKKGDEIMQLLKNLNKSQNVSLIIITHDPGVAKQAGRTLEMRDGKLR